MKTQSEIVLSPIHKRFFSGRLWMGLDYAKMRSCLQELLPGVSIRILPFPDLIRHIGDVGEKSVVFHSSSYDASYSKYLSDTRYHMAQVRPDLIFAPSFDLLLSHENKGYQELVKRKLGIASPEGMYFGDIQDMGVVSLNDFPYVVKLLDGAMSSNVFIAHSYNELRDGLRQRATSDFKNKVRRAFKAWFIKYRYKVEPSQTNKQNFDDFFRARMPFVLQEFVPGLGHDYKVLVFGQRYYVLKRYVRDGDFRASGSGKFVYEAPPAQVLDYAREVFDLFGCPFISLDIAEKEGRCYLIEFQGIGFGPITLENSTGYYTPAPAEVDGWRFAAEVPDLEASYALAISEFFLASLDGGMTTQ